MKFLLDTMVISESARPRPDPKVLEWLAGQPGIDLGISVLTLGEVAKGVARMPNGHRKRDLAHWLETDLSDLFRDRVLWVDQRVALAWGTLAAGRPHLPVIDGLLLASAQVHGLTLVTRNVRDTAGLGVPVLDPWSHQRFDPDQPSP